MKLNSCTFFKFVNGILCNWESLCDIWPDCHHYFDASGTSNAMFDELAERSLRSPLAGTKHTHVRLAIIVYCQILALFFRLYLKDFPEIPKNWLSVSLILFLTKVCCIVTYVAYISVLLFALHTRLSHSFL